MPITSTLPNGPWVPTTAGRSEIEGQGAFPDYIPKNYDPVAFFAGEEKLPNGYNAAVTFNIDLKYDGGNQIIVTHDGNGILFEGEKGRIFVNRGKLTGKPVEDMTDAEKKDLDAAVAKLYRGKQPGNHMNNFFECVKGSDAPHLRHLHPPPLDDLLPHVQHRAAAETETPMGSQGGAIRRRRPGERLDLPPVAQAVRG